MDAEQIFHENIHVAERASSYISRKFNLKYQEVLEEAQVSLFLIIQHGPGWDPKKGTLADWLRNKLVWNLMELYTRGRIPNHPDLKMTDRHEVTGVLRKSDGFEQDGDEADSIPDWMEDKSSEKSSWFQRLLVEVSEECRAFLHIIREAPDDLMEEIGPQRGRRASCKRQRLYRWLVDVRDWNPAKVHQVFAEVEACL